MLSTMASQKKSLTSSENERLELLLKLYEKMSK